MRYFRCLLLVLCGLVLPAQAQIVFQGLSVLNSSQQQALNRAKADIEKMLVFKAPVYVAVAINSDLSCGENSAVLAQAGPTNIYRDAAGFAEPKTWYAASLAVQLSVDAKNSQAANASIEASFNSLTQPKCGFSWYYGTATPGGNQVSFYETAIHEIMHGLGFISFQSSNGQWFRGFNDIFSRNLGTGSSIYPAAWREQPTAEQGAQQMQSNNVYWQGLKGQQFASLLLSSAGRPKIYAPNHYESGSSISHFDSSTRYISGHDEMMEPYASTLVLSQLSAAIFCDIGWALKTDFDNDGVDDCSDPLPFIAQPPAHEQPNPDDNLPIGEDADGDGIANEDDNCPQVFNPLQLDRDQNSKGDVCSPIVPTDVAWGEIPQQRFGTVLAAAAAGDMDGDGYGDYWAASPKVAVTIGGKLQKGAGAVHLMSGKTNRLIYGAIDSGVANGQFGSQIIGNVDFDGDGCLDTFFSAPNETVIVDEGGKKKKRKAAGAVYQFSPFERDGDFCIWHDTLPKRIYSGSQSQAKAGTALLFVDDGINEPTLLIGEPGRSSGAGYKRAGAVVGLSKSWKSDVFYGKASGELAGSYLAHGRFDGLQTVVAVAAPGVRRGKQRGGVYWVNLHVGLNGELNGELNPNKLQPTLLPATLKNCALNGSLATIRVNGSDILAAASPACRLSHVKQGAVWLLGSDNSISVLEWPQARLGLGISLVAADVSGDGIDDLIIGSAQAYIDRKNTKPPANAGNLIIYDPTKRPLYRNGILKNEQFGCAMAAAFIDDDRRADLLVSSCGASVAGKAQLGFVEIFLGRFFN